MPGLPDRPHLDQLRRQARELIRAARGGEPAAVARIRVVSERMTLSAAQLALAREYGCRNWAALRAETERRRRFPVDRWSFGGAAAIETISGMLHPEGLVAGANGAVLYTSLTPAANDARPGRETLAGRLADDGESQALEWAFQEAAVLARDISVADDQGAVYTLLFRQGSGAFGRFPRFLSFRVDPVPWRGVEWVELGGRHGTRTRLLPSPRAVARLGSLTPVTASPAGRELAGGAQSTTGLQPGTAVDTLDAAELTDGLRCHLDLGITLPSTDGMTVRLDSLISVPSGWSLSLRAYPRWWRYRDDQRRKQSPVQMSAEDDLGGGYLCQFSGSAGRDGCEELRLLFRPRLDPLARRLRLTCTGSGGQVTVDVDLVPAG
jgi:hypothetical protein